MFTVQELGSDLLKLKVINSMSQFYVNTMLNLLKRTMTYPGFEPETFGVAVSIPNNYIIEVVITRY
jgi:hypothetical protein